MIENMYQEYLRVIGTLKDAYKLEVEADHRDIHTFYYKKVQVFKLMFGQYVEDAVSSIVVSFHIDLLGPDAIDWFTKIQGIHPPVRLAESYIEDDRGETYLGEDAEKVRDLKTQQQVLKMWLNSSSKKEIEEFVASKVVGRMRDHKKTYDSQTEIDKAIIEFDLMKKPISDDECH